MKKIKLINYSIPSQSPQDRIATVKESMYCVWLGNGVKNYYSNERVALAFLAETNRFLNYKLHELNYQRIQISGEYYKNWFNFFDKRGKSNTDLKRLELKCRDSLSDIDKQFDKLIHNTSGPNGNWFAFTFFYNIISSMNEILALLKSLLNKRRLWVEIQRIEVIRQQLLRIKRTIEVYGKKDADEIDEDISFEFSV